MKALVVVVMLMLALSAIVIADSREARAELTRVTAELAASRSRASLAVAMAEDRAGMLTLCLEISHVLVAERGPNEGLRPPWRRYTPSAK